jgi:hypothetical protein
MGLEKPAILGGKFGVFCDGLLKIEGIGESSDFGGNFCEEMLKIWEIGKWV